MQVLHLTPNIEVLDKVKDDKDRTLILKTMIENDILTLVAFYDTNENRDNHLKHIDTLLTQIDSRQGIIIGADFNNFTDNIKE